MRFCPKSTKLVCLFNTPLRYYVYSLCAQHYMWLQLISCTSISIQHLHFNTPVTSLLNLALLVTPKKEAHDSLPKTLFTERKYRSEAYHQTKASRLSSVFPTKCAQLHYSTASFCTFVFFYSIVPQVRIHILGGCLRSEIARALSHQKVTRE
jgi:hypothetical protein